MDTDDHNSLQGSSESVNVGSTVLRMRMSSESLPMTRDKDNIHNGGKLGAIGGIGNSRNKTIFRKLLIRHVFIKRLLII